MKYVILFVMFVLVSVGVYADGCKPPLQYAVNNRCDLYKAGGVVNKYVCGNSTIYSDCEGIVYKEEKILPALESKEVSKGFIIGLVVGEVLLIMIAILIVVSIVKTRSSKK